MNWIDVRLLWRDWRGGQLNMIMSALIMAITVVTAVSLLTDRVERGLDAQMSGFLAADMVLAAGIAIDQKYMDQAQRLMLQTAQTAQFRSMVFAKKLNHLASVKAVSTSYPLRGELKVSQTPILDGNNIEITYAVPSLGEVWVDPRLLGLLEIELGDFVEVGYSSLKVTRLIVNEPDRGMGFSMVGARVMMNYQDLAKAQLIRPGSQIKYRLLMAGNEVDINKFKRWYQQEEEFIAGQDGVSHYRLQTPEKSEESLSEALRKGRTFLLLSSIIGVLLAGLAMALASHRYASRLTDQVALMKAWGQSSANIRRSHFFRLLIIATSSTLIGMLIGWFAHTLLLGVANELVELHLPSAGWRPWVLAAITGLVCILGFTLPAMFHLPTIAPLKVLRRDLPDDLLSQGKRLIIGVLALFGLTLWYSQNFTITVMFLGALFALFTICALIAMQILKAVQHLGRWRGSYVRLGLANLWRRRNQTLVQLVGFSTTLMLLLVVVGMRTSLIADWQAQLPSNAPSHFLFNVASDELDSVKSFLSEQQVKTTQWYPMVRGRLIGLNGHKLSRERLSQVGGLSREVNFTQSNDIPSDNQIIEGQWWPAVPKERGQTLDSIRAQFSMEQDVAKELGVGVGDLIEFSIGGLTFEATLTSIRRVNWQSMNPNFFIVFSPGILDRYFPNWITSLRVSEGQSAILTNHVIKQFPTAVVIEVSDVIAQLRSIIARVTQGLEMILLLVLACGVLVLFATIGVSFDERLKESAILRTLGSSRKILIGSLGTEFAVLGGIAGFIASVGAEVVLYFVQWKLFDMQPSFHPSLWLLGIGSGVCLVTILGLIRSWDIITVPPLESLRRVM